MIIMMIILKIIMMTKNDNDDEVDKSDQEAQRQRPASLSVKKPSFLRSASVQDASPVGRALTMSSFAASNKSITKYFHSIHPIPPAPPSWFLSSASSS